MLDTKISSLISKVEKRRLRKLGGLSFKDRMAIINATACYVNENIRIIKKRGNK